ncbi:LysR family transcriptional regulator [Rhodophyticola sp. CCM32]|uniref:LysR family transcriptional regulator n=1 Tax=Rhodophyticola sp. CCM32 TaxID=2916397 RepID=UPI00107F246A|nr:LysR family transcriptional regulator [Rhodophyticola sp. CCM32]QBY02553.1 LysR family transcriptional regulator [Rhodophyticola sp. CCM32]
MEILFDLKELRTFALLAETLSFTDVALRLNTVQSAVSAQINKLEAGLGQQLVSRGRGKKVALTPDGEVFLVYVKRILALTEEAVEAVQTVNARQVLRLGTTVTLAMSLVAETLNAFAKLRPDIQIQIQCDRSDRLLQRLEEGDIDVAFMMDQGRHSLRAFVLSVELAWVASPTFEMPDESPIPLAFLSDGRDLRRYALRALDAAGMKGRVSHLSPHPVGVRTLVQAGLALSVMPSQTIVPPLVPADPSLGLPQLASIALAAYKAPHDPSGCQGLLIEELSCAARHTR